MFGNVFVVFAKNEKEYCYCLLRKEMEMNGYVYFVIRKSLIIFWNWVERIFHLSLTLELDIDGIVNIWLMFTIFFFIDILWRNLKIFFPYLLLRKSFNVSRPKKSSFHLPVSPSPLRKTWSIMVIPRYLTTP